MHGGTDSHGVHFHLPPRQPPLTYVKETLSGEMPQVYTIKTTEQQAEENMMGVIRARNRKAAVLPREYGPVN